MNESAGVGLLGLTRQQLSAYVAEQGLPSYRGRQLFQALHHRLVETLDEVYELPRAARRQLAAAFNLAPLHATQVVEAADGTRRYLFTVRGGQE
ncbi:MAG: hypothetical protein SNJ67_09930, partial [Chloracidobacterium sp.]